MATKKKLRTSISRLRRLMAHLTTIPQTMWNMDTFGDQANKTMCKTACCVLGHAATVPEFKKLGLKWTGYKNPWTTITTWSITFDDAAYQDAGEKFFGLSHVESEKLFFSGYDKSVGRKIDEIRTLIEKREKQLANL